VGVFGGALKVMEATLENLRESLSRERGFAPRDGRQEARELREPGCSRATTLTPYRLDRLVS
jgi:hypothetical protein